VGIKATILLAGLTALLLAPPPAHAQRTTYQRIAQCTRFATVQFSRHDPAFRRFVIDRVTVQDDKFADRVGNQFVSSIYHGKATYEGGAGPKKVRFICLHAGIGKGPVFVYALPE
jgi:hypothetical protein